MRRNVHRERNGHASRNGHADGRAANGNAPERRHAAADGDGGGADVANGGGGHHKRHRDYGEAAGEAHKHRVHIDGASAQKGADLKYGLNFGGSAPDELQRHDRCLQLGGSTL